MPEGSAEAAEKLPPSIPPAKLADEIAGMNAKMDVEAAAEAKRMQETARRRSPGSAPVRNSPGEQEVKKAPRGAAAGASLLTAHAAEELVRKPLSPRTRSAWSVKSRKDRRDRH